MRKRIIMAMVVAIFTVISADAIPSRPQPQRLVNDMAGLFTPSQTQGLEHMLVEFDDTTSNQIAVITTLDLEGYDAAEYATRIGIEWQVGSEKFDNGIVIVVKPKTSDSSGKVFIAVGYGLEGAIPDAYVKRIIESQMIPHFKTNNYFAGVEAACSTLMKLASGEISEMRGNEDDAKWVIIGVIAIFFIVIFSLAAIWDENKNNRGFGGRRRTIYTGPIITSGRNYGGFRGGSFGGGGFSGGFGGFGGGSFGGGGAGGSW